MKKTAMAEYRWNRSNFQQRASETTEKAAQKAAREAPRTRQPGIGAYERGAYAL